MYVGENLSRPRPWSKIEKPKSRKKRGPFVGTLAPRVNVEVHSCGTEVGVTAVPSSPGSGGAPLWTSPSGRCGATPPYFNNTLNRTTETLADSSILKRTGDHFLLTQTPIWPQIRNQREILPQIGIRKSTHLFFRQKCWKIIFFWRKPLFDHRFVTSGKFYPKSI